MPSNRIIKAITQAAEIVFKSLHRITSVGGKGGYPKQIPESLEIGTASQSGDSAAIDIASVDRGEENVAITLAFEQGSGLTGPKGQRYKIEPKEKNALAFLWPEAGNISASDTSAPDLAISKSTGKVLLPYVMHPGIIPRPFIDRAILESVGEVTELLADEFVIDIANAIIPEGTVTMP